MLTEGIIGAIGMAVGTALAYVIRAARERDTPHPAPSMGSGPHAALPPASLSPEVTVALEHIRELREHARQADRESVYAAESRKVVAQTAEALQALVISLDRDREERQRETTDARKERRELARALQSVIALIEGRR